MGFHFKEKLNKYFISIELNESELKNQTLPVDTPVQHVVYSIFLKSETSLR